MSRRRSLILVATALAVLAAVPAAPAFGAGQRQVDRSAAAAVAALPPLGPGDWPNRHNKPPGGGVNRAETAITVGNAPGLHIATVKAAESSGSTGQAGGTGHGLLFYGPPGGGVRAEDEVTGAVRWTSSVGSASLSVGEEAVYSVALLAPAGKTGVFALDVRTGRQLWHRSLPGLVRVSSPLLVGDRLLVSWTNDQGPLGARSVVTSFDPATGAKQWQTKVGNGERVSQASVSGNVVAITTDNGVLRTLDLSTGTIRWSFSAGGSGLGLAQVRPVIRGHRLYVGLLVPQFHGFVGAFNLDTGTRLWSRDLDVSPFFDLVEDGGVVYLAAQGNGSVDDLFALDGNTGSTLWSTASGADGTPTLADGVLFVPTFFGGTALKTYSAATGALLGTIPLDDPAFSEPMISHGRVYLLAEFGELDVITP